MLTHAVTGFQMHLQTHLDSFHEVCVVPGVDFSRAWDEGSVREHVTYLRQEGAIWPDYRAQDTCSSRHDVEQVTKCPLRNITG
jgi:hypothetical protein